VQTSQVVDCLLSGGDSGGSGGDGSGGDGGSGGNVVTDVTDPTEAFNAIWAREHYSNDEKSRTHYQVDRSLDYIEQKLAEMHAVFVA